MIVAILLRAQALSGENIALSIDFELWSEQQFLLGDIRESWEGFKPKWFVVTLAAPSSVKKEAILSW